MPDAAISEVEINHRALLGLCDMLESIADRLPGNLDRDECLVLARSLSAMVHRIQNHEEAVLFPALLQWHALLPEMAQTIDRLRVEHQVDICYAEDVEDMLRSYGESRPSVGADAAGFMLRGFFEALRRHVAFERTLLVPLLGMVPPQQRLN
jgi:hemerythrin-like domain-containing protein